MAVPSQKDISIRKMKLESFLKELDDTGKMSEKKALNVVRGAIRQAWMKSPVKLAYLYENTIIDNNPKTRTKWLWKCECCHAIKDLKNIQVDHINGGNSLLEKEQFVEFFESILMVSKDDLQILCLRCHDVKTLSELLGISFEEAIVEKEVIAICKNKSAQIDEWLMSNGIKPVKKSDVRRNNVRECLLSGGKWK